MNRVELDSANQAGRRKWLAWMGVLSVFSLFRIRSFSNKKAIIDCAPAGNKETVKLLSQDGELVEVDVSRINVLEQKVSDEQLRNWIIKP